LSIEDLRVISPGSHVDADVCIVGSGPAGFTLATELAARGIKVVVLESGGRERDPWSESMDEIESVGAPRELDAWKVRNRVLGGSSFTWGGRLATFDETDFRVREWVPGSGWPITRDALRPYIARAASRLNTVVADNNAPDAVRFISARIPEVSADVLAPYMWSYSRHDASRRDYTRYGRLAQESGFDGAQCFVHATVTQIETDLAGKVVQRLEVRGADGEARWVDSKCVVLCAGGIENARLLLASNRIVSVGLGNERDLVGRFLMDHLRGPVAWFAERDVNAAQRLFGDFLVDASALPAELVPSGATGKGQLTPGYALSPRVQELEGLLNCAVFVKGEPAEDDPLDAALQLARLENPIGNLKHLARHPRLTLEALERPLLRGRMPVRRVAGLSLQCIVEQRPDRDSRVTLADRTDPLGMPLARVDWRISDQEAQTVRRATHIFVEEMRRLGLPVPVPVAMVADEESAFFLPEVAHPTGTTRMSANPDHGVVDPNCAIHGMSGLYVVGSSVFPTSGHANPTHQIIALAIRLADHLGTKLRGHAMSPPRPVAQTASESPRTNAPRVLAAGTGSTFDRLPNPEAKVNRTVLVTGATGRIGRRVVEFLLRDGFSVRALTSRVAPERDDGIEWRVHDLRQADLDFREDVRGCVGIVHLAAEQVHVDDMYRVNAEATGALARAAECAGVSVMVYTSTMSVYGSPTRPVVSEDAPVLTADRDIASEYWEDALTRAYGRTKLQGEAAIAAAARKVQYVIFRPTAVYAPSDLVDMAGWTTRARMVLWRQRSHAINVDDVAEAIVWALERGVAGRASTAGIAVYNLSDEITEHRYGDVWSAFNDGIEPPPSRVAFAVPAIAAWALFWLRYRGRPRRLVGQVTYSASRLHAAGYKHRHGLKVLVEDGVSAMRGNPAER